MSNEETEQADAEEETLQYDFEVMRRNQLDWRQERNQYDFRTTGGGDFGDAHSSFSIIIAYS